MQSILDGRLLADDGIILVDNGTTVHLKNQLCLTGVILNIEAVFARGFVVDKNNSANIDPLELDRWVQAGELMQAFNRALMDDPRIDVTLLPIFDGVSRVRWKRTEKQ